MVWQNDDMVLFHGCTNESLRPLNAIGITVGALPNNINPAQGARRADFGRGFYATTWLHQAKSWANIRFMQTRRFSGKQAIVLEFRVRRNDLANLETLTFVTEKSGYFPFVQYCRSGRRLHADAAFRQPPYDVVFGPVALGGQPLVISGCDQVSFHTDLAVSKISEVSVIEAGNPTFDLSQ